MKSTIEMEYLRRELESTRKELEDKSDYVKNAYKKFGRIFEQYAPFTKNFPCKPDKFKFLGQPIDGIIFEDDKIIFVEIKTNGGYLTPNQERVKKLVQEGKVEFKEVRFT